MSALTRPAAIVAALVLCVATAGCADPLGPREWTVLMDVAPQRVPCTGMAPMECLVVRERPDTAWTYFYDGIEGFEFEPGFDYTLRVRVREIRNPPADGSSRAYRLLELVSKAPAA